MDFSEKVREKMSIEQLLMLIYVFVLATYTGIELISKVPPTLHTPLMSGSNAISGITIVGAILCTGTNQNLGEFSKIFGMIALVMATINVVGGYLVTERMLKMFKKK
jgi:H+-translocating NAD(P) transhydrogenase subunit alpha